MIYHTVHVLRTCSGSFQRTQCHSIRSVPTACPSNDRNHITRERTTLRTMYEFQSLSIAPRCTPAFDYQYVPTFLYLLLWINFPFSKGMYTNCVTTGIHIALFYPVFFFSICVLVYSTRPDSIRSDLAYIRKRYAAFNAGLNIIRIKASPNRVSGSKGRG